jgi:hypothetical protein
MALLINSVRSPAFKPSLIIFVGLLLMRSQVEASPGREIALLVAMLWVLLWWRLIRRLDVLPALMMVPVTGASMIALSSVLHRYERFVSERMPLYAVGLIIVGAAFAYLFYSRLRGDDGVKVKHELKARHGSF